MKTHTMLLVAAAGALLSSCAGTSKSNHVVYTQGVLPKTNSLHARGHSASGGTLLHFGGSSSATHPAGHHAEWLPSKAYRNGAAE